MPKVPLSTITSGYGTVDALNANFDAIEAAFDNTLSRNGDTPNQMSANLDMNGFSILNQANPITVEGFNWEGQWLTATAYQVGDVVQQEGSAYICVVAHTSGVFATDLAAFRWQLVAQANFPTQTGNSGKYLTTNGTSASWDDVKYTPLGTGAVQRTVTSKVQESVSIKDFGAVGDGVANDLTKFVAARDAGKPYFVPSGTYNLNTAFDSGNTPVIFTGGTINALVPNNTYFRSSIDLGKKTVFRTSIRDSSEYTGTPSTYTYIKDLTSLNIRHINGAGYQQFYSSDAGGRTSVPAIYIEMDHIGYGDCPGVSTHIGVQRHPNWASISGSWTGANSGVLYDGGVAAVTGNVNIYGMEFELNDNGNERVAANGIVARFIRQNGNPSNSGAYNTVWSGFRAMSQGTFSADSAFLVQGKWNVGLDFALADFSNKAAIALKTDDRIYFGIPFGSPPTKWYADQLSLHYQTFDGSKYNFVVNNVPSFTVAQNEVVSAAIHKFIGSFNVVSTGNTASTVGAAGAASALPGTPFTYLIIKIDGSNYKIPVYNN